MNISQPKLRCEKFDDDDDNDDINVFGNKLSLLTERHWFFFLLTVYDFIFSPLNTNQNYSKTLNTGSTLPL